MEIIKILPREKAREIYSHIRQELIPHATPERTQAGQGRLQLWLEKEPIYSQPGTYKTGIHDPRLWRLIQWIAPQADLAQVYGGNRGIDWHRDAAYAAPTAWILNLGPCTLESDHGEIISLDLTGGEIIRFNCKVLHRCTNPHPQRIGIGIWQCREPQQYTLI